MDIFVLLRITTRVIAADMRQLIGTCVELSVNEYDRLPILFAIQKSRVTHCNSVYALAAV